MMVPVAGLSVVIGTGLGQGLGRDLTVVVAGAPKPGWKRQSFSPLLSV